MYMYVEDGLQFSKQTLRSILTVLLYFSELGICSTSVAGFATVDDDDDDVHDDVTVLWPVMRLSIVTKSTAPASSMTSLDSAFVFATEFSCENAGGTKPDLDDTVFRAVVPPSRVIAPEVGLVFVLLPCCDWLIKMLSINVFAAILDDACGEEL